MNYLILITPIICIILAAALAFYGIEGWGWFLFVGVITSGTDLIKNISKKNNEPESEQ